MPLNPRGVAFGLVLAGLTASAGRASEVCTAIADAGGGRDEGHAYGWFVGWAAKDGRNIVFSRLIQDEQAEAQPAGLRARTAFLGELPAFLATLEPRPEPGGRTADKSP